MKLPGIGPKTGQKMILALRNVLVLEDEKTPNSPSTKNIKLKLWSDIIDALVDMGYDRRRIEEVVDKLVTEQAEKLEEFSRHDAEEYLFRSAIVALG